MGHTEGRDCGNGEMKHNTVIAPEEGKTSLLSTMVLSKVLSCTRHLPCLKPICTTALPSTSSLLITFHIHTNHTTSAFTF